MTSLWPSDIAPIEVRTPRQILEEQAKELEAMTDNRLKAQVTVEAGADQIVLGFEVVSARTDRRLRLFQAFHRTEVPYPVKLSNPAKLPEYLKDQIWQPGTSPLGLGHLLVGTEGKWVDNENVCGTPEEFIDSLEKLLSRKAVKASVIGLLADTNVVPPPEPNAEPPSAESAGLK